jgi:hypothetical protein
MGAPLPGGVYAPGTMAIADIYPTHAGIGGITTQDRALPAFADEVAAMQAGSLTRTGLDSELLGQPAGYLILIGLGLVAAAWVLRD